MRLLGSVALFAFAAAGIAAAQNIPFQILLTSGTTSATVANNSSVGFDAEVGKSAVVQVKATYIGTGQVSVTMGPQLLGSSEFNANLSGMLPLKLAPGDSVAFSITFTSQSASAASAQLSLPFSETLTTGTTSTTNQSAINLILQGTSPAYQLSYILSSNQNVVPLPSGGTIPFPATQVNSSSTALLNISNSGSGTGQISAISQPTDPAFKLAGVPLLPYTIASLATLQLQITYTPTAATSDTDQIQVTLGSGNDLMVGLQGNGINATFTYQLIQNGTPTPVTPPGPITLPDTNVGSTNSIIVQVQNSGNATGTINSPPVASGSGFSVTDNTVFPQILKPGNSFTFSINFMPTQAGAQKGTLVVGSDLFTLTGNGLGANLTFSYTSSAGTITLGTNPTVVFSPIAVSKSEKVTFTVMNSGTLSTTVSNIGIGEASSPYTVSGLPTLPVTVGAGKSFQFTVNFAPTVTGFSNGTLHIDTNIINLTGSGTAPPTLPGYTIEGPTGNVSPRTQPTIGLTLASSYPVDLAGTLTLSTSGNLVADPAVMFSTGGRTVPFTIPANTTKANFSGLGTQIFLQTGTVASTITLTPSFTTAAGNINVTPSNPNSLVFTVPAAAPVLIAVTITNLATSGFTLDVTGYSTTRTLTNMVVQFTAAAGFNLSSSQVTIDLSQVSSLWFESTASEAFGGQFLVTVPFSLAGTLPTGKTLIQAISAVSATVSNEVGTSNSLQTTLQ